MQLNYVLFFQFINTTGARVCLKELYASKYDPLSVSYTVLSGKKWWVSKGSVHESLAGDLLKRLRQGSKDIDPPLNLGLQTLTPPKT